MTPNAIDNCFLVGFVLYTLAMFWSVWRLLGMAWEALR
jgi:hypothetical protein